MKRIKFAIIGALLGYFVIVAIWAPFVGLVGAFNSLNLPGAIIGAIIGYLIGKNEDDEINTEKHQMPQPKTDATTLLLEYKKLLDAGGITQEEFDKKKEELLENL